MAMSDPYVDHDVLRALPNDPDLLQLVDLLSDLVRRDGYSIDQFVLTAPRFVRSTACRELRILVRKAI